MSAIEWFHCICIQPNSQYMVAMIISWHCCTLQSLHTCLIDTMQVQHVIYNGYSYNTYSHTLYTWSSGYSHTVLNSDCMQPLFSDSMTGIHMKLLTRESSSSISSRKSRLSWSTWWT